MIRLENVTKNYRTIGRVVVPALHQINLTIERGEMVALVGSSGSGTSTIMNILGCLDSPTSGRYLLDGRDVSRLSKRQLTRVRATSVGFALHLAGLSPDLSVLRNVEFPSLFSRGKPKPRQRALNALARVGLAEYQDAPPDALNVTQQRRVVIARALVHEPAVLLQDEPTAGLDHPGAEQIIALLEELNASGLTVAFSTHDPDVARHARRTIEIADGRVVADPDTPIVRIVPESAR